MRVAMIVNKGLTRFQHDLEKADKSRKYAARIAVRVEANRLRLKMKVEIKAGSPGGHNFAPLSKIASLYRSNRKPLSRLALAVRYWEKQLLNGEIYSVGFNGGSVIGLNGSRLGSNQLSASWLRLVRLHQEGGQLPTGTFNRQASFDGMSLRTKYMLLIGGTGQRRRRGLYKRLSIRQDTSHINIPARPIVEPFWAAHKPEVFRNINFNFQRKMRGERI